MSLSPYGFDIRITPGHQKIELGLLSVQPVPAIRPLRIEFLQRTQWNAPRRQACAAE